MMSMRTFSAAGTTGTPDVWASYRHVPQRGNDQYEVCLTVGPRNRVLAVWLRVRQKAMPILQQRTQC